MARRRRPTDPLTRGRPSPGLAPAWTPGAAPRDFFPHYDLLEDADRRRSIWSDLSPPTPLRTVYQRGTRGALIQNRWSPLYPPAKPRQRLSVFGGKAPSLFAGLEVNKRVLFCLRRKQRRESLFALRRVGFRGSSPGSRSQYNQKYYQRSGDSRYSCR